MSEKLRNGWKIWRFDQMATMVNDRVDNPADAGVERYVGLEHLDSDSLKIRRWGSPDDVEATKLRFQPGDIIFGRRRAYQRKLGVADFEGICSAHAMVLRARPEVVLPEFLPFFMQSDLFMERAKLISVGSLSPTINWKTLAAEEFSLPLLDEQRCMARLFGTVAELSSCYIVAEESLLRTEIALVDNFVKTLQCRGKPAVPLSELVKRKPAYGLNAPATPARAGLPRYLRITDIDDDGLLLDTDVVAVEVNDPTPYRICPGDLLFARTGNTVGKVYLANGSEGDAVYAGYLIRFSPDTRKVMPSYIFALTRSSGYRRWVKEKCRVGAQPNINAKEFGELPIWLPDSLTSQARLVECVEAVVRAKRNLKDRRSVLASLVRKMAHGFEQGTKE